MYPVSVVEEALEDHPSLFTLYRLNPMTRFAEAYRDLLYSLRFPTLGNVAYLMACAAVSLARSAGRRSAASQGRLAEEL